MNEQKYFRFNNNSNSMSFNCLQQLWCATVLCEAKFLNNTIARMPATRRRISHDVVPRSTKTGEDRVTVGLKRLAKLHQDKLHDSLGISSQSQCTQENRKKQISRPTVGMEKKHKNTKGEPRRKEERKKV
jgi:hypothetical protein